MSRKRVWSTEDLQSLTQINNHKIMFDGYEYYWVRRLKDEWKRHFILNFKDKKRLFLISNIVLENGKKNYLKELVR